MADANTGSSGLIRIDVSNSGGDAVNNRSLVSWAFYFIERSVNNSTFANGVAASVILDNVVTLYSGSFNFNWGGAGQQTTLIASGAFGVDHDPDGNKYLAIYGHIGATGTSGGGGPAAVGQGIQLMKLTQLPGTPYNLSASRVSDYQTNLSWQESSPSNGQPIRDNIQHAINDGGWVDLISIGATTAAALGTEPNRKTIYRIFAGNDIGFSNPSAASAPVYTTPAAPINPYAAKNSSLDIWVQFTGQVAYNEHEHVVWHGVVSGGTVTWDASALAYLPAGTWGFNHAAPNPAQVHVYRVRSQAAGLPSAWVETNPVQLLAPPNKPTVPAMPATANKAAAITFTWVHNPVDTSPQRQHELQFSYNGGSTWASNGIATTAQQSLTLPANSFSGNTAVTTRVRTWGSATTGGADGTGASPWSDLRTTTMKTVPTATITVPANNATINDSTLRVSVGFSQPEAATFVKAQLVLSRNGTILEELDSSIQVGIQLATRLQNGLTYTIQARVQDSNGLWSTYAANVFSVTYLQPVPATVTTSYLPETGYGQINLTLPAPGAGQQAAAKVTISRTINGVEEIIVREYAAASTLTFLDTTPTIHGTNTYRVTTLTELGAQVSVTATLITAELRRAFLSKGTGFTTVGVFGGNLEVDETLSVASATVEAAGRSKPVGLYGVETKVSLKVVSKIFEGFGSNVDQMRAVLLTPGKACYRDASGRRVFGTAKGSVSYKRVPRGELSFTIEETS